MNNESLYNLLVVILLIGVCYQYADYFFKRRRKRKQQPHREVWQPFLDKLRSSQMVMMKECIGGEETYFPCRVIAVGVDWVEIEDITTHIVSQLSAIRAIYVLRLMENWEVELYRLTQEHEALLREDRRNQEMETALRAKPRVVEGQIVGNLLSEHDIQVGMYLMLMDSDYSKPLLLTEVEREIDFDGQWVLSYFTAQVLDSAIYSTVSLSRYNLPDLRRMTDEEKRLFGV